MGSKSPKKKPEQSEELVNMLIVNADDLGLSECVNNGIFDAVDNGLVTSTSIMACGRAFDHAVNLAKEREFKGIGVHLVLEVESPLLSPGQIPSLIGDNNRFLQRGQLLKHLLLTKRLNMAELKAELSAQIEKCFDAGLQISHIDGHGHVHVYPRISEVVAELGQKYKINKARIPDEGYFFLGRKSPAIGKHINRAVITSFAKMAKPKYESRGFVFPSKFMGMLFGGNLTREKFELLLQHADKGGSVEIMCHPGHRDDAQLAEYAAWKYHWNDELEAVMAYNKKEAAHKYKTCFATFNEL